MNIYFFFNHVGLNELKDKPLGKESLKNTFVAHF